MTILICLVLGYVAGVVGVWVVIAGAEFSEWRSGLKAKGKS